MSKFLLAFSRVPLPELSACQQASSELSEYSLKTMLSLPSYHNALNRIPTYTAPYLSHMAVQAAETSLTTENTKMQNIAVCRRLKCPDHRHLQSPQEEVSKKQTSNT